MRQQQRSKRQQEIAEQLAAQFYIDAARVLFLNEEKPEEPWLPAEALITIARQSGGFQAIDESYRDYIPGLNQVVHSATVVDRDGRSYTRSGVATVDEREEVSTHALAAGRAVSAALTAAGFNPLRPGAVVSAGSSQEGDTSGQADAANSRNIDLKRIHTLAEQKGLIRRLPGEGVDRAGYRQLLVEKFGTNTAAGFDQAQRASLINFIEQLPDPATFADVSDEFAEVAAV
jgi:hypothetical protein